MPKLEFTNIKKNEKYRKMRYIDQWNLRVDAMKSDRRYKWSWLILFLFLFLYAYVADFGCVFLRIFHIICPGCGMTRAVKAVLRLDLYSAFLYHPMVFTMPLVAVYIIKDGQVFRDKYVNIIVISLIGIGFLVNYVFKLIEFL